MKLAFCAYNCRYMNTLGNKKIELFDMGAGVSEPTEDDNVKVASCKILILFTLH